METNWSTFDSRWNSEVVSVVRITAQVIAEKEMPACEMRSVSPSRRRYGMER
jgi:hypothetical protein